MRMIEVLRKGGPKGQRDQKFVRSDPAVVIKQEIEDEEAGEEQDCGARQISKRSRPAKCL